MTVTQGTLDVWPSRLGLVALFDRKYRRSAVMGWGPQMRFDLHYFNPDDHYEAILVSPGAWCVYTPNKWDS